MGLDDKGQLRQSSQLKFILVLWDTVSSIEDVERTQASS